MRGSIAASLAAALLVLAAFGQDAAADRPVVLMVKRALTVSGAPVDDAAILIEGGRITAIGTRDEVDVPFEADVIEIPGAWATPGFIHPASLAFTGAGNYDTSGRNNAADRLVADELSPSWQGVAILAAAGFTRANVIVSNGGVAGRSVLVKPLKKLDRPIRREDVVAVRDVALCMGFEPRTTTKAFWTETLAKARKLREDRAGGAASRPAGGAGAESRPEGESRPATRPAAPADDPKLTPIADVLDSRMPGILDLGGAAAVLHFLPLLKDAPEFKPAVMLRAGDSWRCVEHVKKLAVPVILTPERVAKPDTNVELVPVRDFVDAGIAVALIPETSFSARYEGFAFHLAELVRKGVASDVVLRAVTLTPAEILGIQKDVGSLEKGKAGDVLLWSADPFAPEATLLRVIVGGVTVHDGKEVP